VSIHKEKRNTLVYKARVKKKISKKKKAPATGAGVGGGHQKHPTGEAAALLGPADPKLPLLERLAQLVEHLTAEFRQFIEEQDAVVGEAQFPGPRQGAATDQGGGGA